MDKNTILSNMVQIISIYQNLINKPDNEKLLIALNDAHKLLERAMFNDIVNKLINVKKEYKEATNQTPL